MPDPDAPAKRYLHPLHYATIGWLAAGIVAWIYLWPADKTADVGVETAAAWIALVTSWLGASITAVGVTIAGAVHRYEARRD